MLKIIIAVENMRIGGYQRLALDQAFELSDMGMSPLMLLMQKDPKGLVSFRDSENEFIVAKGLKFQTLAGNFWSDFRNARSLLVGPSQKVLVISHSMRSTVLFRLAKIGLTKKIVINTTIHQLPTLSAFSQRIRRFLYSQFSDNLYAYSLAVLEDWKHRYRDFGKNITLLRNGIYLNRLPEFKDLDSSPRNRLGRLIFLGRSATWKGLDIYFDLFKLDSFKDFRGLMMVANSSEYIVNQVSVAGRDKIELIVGANLKNYIPSPGDLHIYPAQYGPKARFVEPISLNCLEMAAMGVPSLVTNSSQDTWSDLTKLGIFKSVDWKKLDQGEIGEFITSTKISRSSVSKLRGIVNIRNNVMIHLKSIE